MSNREFKLKLWQADPHCYYCGRLTQLLNVKEFKGPQPPDLATLDHLYSRLDPQRWIKRDQSKVLACYECNSNRAIEETKKLSKEELIKRGKGFSLNPRGKPIFTTGLSSMKEVVKVMQEKLPDFDWYKNHKQL